MRASRRLCETVLHVWSSPQDNAKNQTKRCNTTNKVQFGFILQEELEAWKKCTATIYAYFRYMLFEFTGDSFSPDDDSISVKEVIKLLDAVLKSDDVVRIFRELRPNTGYWI